MKEQNKIKAGKELKQQRHPIRQQLLAVVLGVCLTVVSVPVSSFGGSVQASPERRGTQGGDGVMPVSGDDGGSEGPAVTGDDGENKQFFAEFYSGSAGDKEKVAAVMAEDEELGTVTAPALKPLAGYAAVGWEEHKDAFGGEIKEGATLALTGNSAYYGVYRKNVTLTYEVGGGEACPESETQACSVNVSEGLTYDVPSFTAAAEVRRTGYVFAGWNTKADGSGTPVAAGGTLELDSDTMLYAMWVEGNGTPYRVEHYKQDVVEDAYTRIDADTEYLMGKTDELVEAEPNPYTGFTVSTNPELGKPSGIVEADGSLVLQLYYDRNVYQIDFDLNGGEGDAPKMQSVRYGGFLQEPEIPQRRGYIFKGWYLDSAGTESACWDFYQTIERNTGEREATLYAKWADETAPVLGEAAFGTGSRNFADWVIGREKLTITVPITEEGSGLKQGDYWLQPETGRPRAGTAFIRAQRALTPEIRGRSGGVSAVMTIRGNAKSGESVAVITIDEDFKGSVSLTCTDNAGNVSVEKVLTADGAGVIVEDKAPYIGFSKAQSNVAEEGAKINVDVSDTAGSNVTAGLAAISYQIDDGEAKEAGSGEFSDAVVESYSFTVNIQGEGEHTLKVTAVDNAGNESMRKAAVKILGEGAAVTPKPETPAQTPAGKSSNTSARTSAAGGEPKTGDSTPVKVFATLGMVAGFTYLLLYFNSGESGITEGEKEEIISRLVRWARKGKLRKYPAILIISVFLFYYHSIGRSVSDEWKKVYEG